MLFQGYFIHLQSASLLACTFNIKLLGTILDLCNSQQINLNIRPIVDINLELEINTRKCKEAPEVLHLWYSLQNNQGNYMYIGDILSFVSRLLFLGYS